MFGKQNAVYATIRQAEILQCFLQQQYIFRLCRVFQYGNDFACFYLLSVSLPSSVKRTTKDVCCFPNVLLRLNTELPAGTSSSIW